MELRQLRYFVTVAELLHFGRAADRLGIVQAAVSQQIARLERELSLELFDRSHRRVRLTPDGQAFLTEALRVLAAADAARTAAARLAAAAQGVVRVGTSEGLSGRLDAVLEAFRAPHPNADLDLVSLTTPDKVEAVAEGALDVAFVRAAESAPGVLVLPLWVDRLSAAIPAAVAPSAAGPVDLLNLAALPLALARPSSNPGVHELILAGCQAAGFDPVLGPAFTTPQDTVSGHVAAGRCWTLLYDTTTLAIPATVRLVPTRPSISIPVGLAVRSGAMRPLVHAFITAAQSLPD